ncbi:MAG TPA: hypothetical protein VMV31_11280 [Terriglobales bacterium]|nr:hypothetical protein [Terriglobales bacterium]
MAARKSLLHRAPARPELDALLEKAHQQGVSDEQLRDQRVSFAYGNAPFDKAGITKQSAETSSRRNRLVLP